MIQRIQEDLKSIRTKNQNPVSIIKLETYLNQIVLTRSIIQCKVAQFRRIPDKEIKLRSQRNQSQFFDKKLITLEPQYSLSPEKPKVVAFRRRVIHNYDDQLQKNHHFSKKHESNFCDEQEQMSKPKSIPLLLKVDYISHEDNLLANNIFLKTTSNTNEGQQYFHNKLKAMNKSVQTLLPTINSSKPIIQQIRQEGGQSFLYSTSTMRLKSLTNNLEIISPIQKHKRTNVIFQPEKNFQNTANTFTLNNFQNTDHISPIIKKQRENLTLTRGRNQYSPQNTSNINLGNIKYDSDSSPKKDRKANLQMIRQHEIKPSRASFESKLLQKSQDLRSSLKKELLQKFQSLEDSTNAYGLNNDQKSPMNLKMKQKTSVQLIRSKGQRNSGMNINLNNLLNIQDKEEASSICEEKLKLFCYKSFKDIQIMEQQIIKQGLSDQDISAWNTFEKEDTSD